MATGFFFSPTMFQFGRGEAKSVGERFARMGCKKILVVFDKGVEGAGIAETVLGYLRGAGLETVCYKDVQPDPPDWSVNECGQMAFDHKVDGFLGLGGGSSMDTAKAAAVLYANRLPINRFFVNPEDPPIQNERPMCPLIVMPTTAGTGSEVSPGGVITDTETGVKHSVNCATTLALVDPDLSADLPPFVTATTGFDALCHAVEALTSRTPNAAARVLGMEAVRLISNNLESAVVNGAGDMKAREAMSLAASLAVMSIIGPFCHLPHEMGLAIGATFHVPHGAACAFSLAEALRYVGPDIPDQMRDVAVSLGIQVSEQATAEEITEGVAEAIDSLYARAKMPRISQYVKSKEDYVMLAEFICETQPCVFSPKAVNKEAFTQILSNSYDHLK